MPQPSEPPIVPEPANTKPAATASIASTKATPHKYYAPQAVDDDDEEDFFDNMPV
ncbi:MAG: hypothetical protein AAGA70_11335 [Pseudomonadota bacterium]